MVCHTLQPHIIDRALNECEQRITMIANLAAATGKNRFSKIYKTTVDSLLFVAYADLNW